MLKKLRRNTHGKLCFSRIDVVPVLTNFKYFRQFERAVKKKDRTVVDRFVARGDAFYVKREGVARFKNRRGGGYAVECYGYSLGKRNGIIVPEQFKCDSETRRLDSYDT